MKGFVPILTAVLALIAGFSLRCAEPRQTVDRYFSFFNPGGPEGLENFRSCFVPEDYSKIKTVPSAETRKLHPVGSLRILDEARTGKLYEIRYRLGNRKGIGYLVLENRDGQWLINASLSSSGRKDALSSGSEPFLPVPLDQDDDPLPKPLPPPPPPTPPVPSGWQPGPAPEWFVNYLAASEKVRERKRNLLILCTGADWCPPCKRLAKEVLQSDEFKEYAAQNLVLLYLNFPRRTPLNPDQLKHNQEIRKKFGFRGGVPSYVLVDPDGQILRRRSGYLPLPAFMDFLQTEKPQKPEPRPAAVRRRPPAPPVKQPELTRRNEPLRYDQQVAFRTGIPTAPSDWRNGPDSKWQIYFPAAMALAKRQHKKVFILHTGSDWCGFCIKLRKDVLSQREFKRFADKNLILLYLDSPRKNPLPPEQQKHNQSVCREFGFPGGVPAFILVDEDGRVIVKRAGYRPLPDYMKLLKEAVKK